MADGTEDPCGEVEGSSELSLFRRVSLSVGPGSHSRSLFAAQMGEHPDLMPDPRHPVLPSYAAAEEAALMRARSNVWQLDQMALAKEAPSSGRVSLGQQMVCDDVGGQHLVATQIIELSDEQPMSPVAATGQRDGNVVRAPSSEWQRQMWQRNVEGSAWQLAQHGRKPVPAVAHFSKENADRTVAKQVSVRGASSTTIQAETAKDFERKLAHKYESVRPGPSHQWSFEMRQVVEEGSDVGVRVHWDARKSAEDEARPPTEKEGKVVGDELNRGATDRAKNEAAQVRDVEDAPDAKSAKSEENAAKEAVPLKAARARINMLAPPTPAATSKPHTTSTKTLPEESGASFVVLRPKESLGDMPIQVSASVNKSQEGQERFAIGVTQAKTRGSIHLEGQIVTPKTSKADLVHGFQMAAVGNVHHVYVTPQPPDWDANYPPHKPTSSEAVDVAQAAADVKNGADAPSAMSADAETNLAVTEGREVNAEPADGKQLPLQTEAEHKLAAEPTTVRETFRAAAVPLVSVPSLGIITKVAAAVRNEEMSAGSGFADLNPPGFIDTQTGGPFLPEQDYKEPETVSRTLSVHSIDRVYEPHYVQQISSHTSAAGELAPYVASSEILGRVPTASAMPVLREEFIFSATTFGLTDKECQALPPVSGPGMSGSRVHLPPTSQMSEFGFSATTVGLTDKDRLAIASNQSLKNRPQSIGRSRSNKSELELSSKKSLRTNSSQKSHMNSRAEFGFSATTIGLTDKDRMAIASNQSLKILPEDIGRSKSNKSEYSLPSKKSLRARGAQNSRRNARTEFGFSATTIGLTENDVQNLPPSRESVQALDTSVHRGPSSKDYRRGFSATAVDITEKEHEEFLPLEDVCRASSGAGRAAGAFSHHSLRGRVLLGNNDEESNLETSSESGDLNGSWAEKFKASASREKLQSSHGYGGYETSEACRPPPGSSAPASVVRPVLSVIREESGPDIIAEHFMAGGRASKTFKVTSARELFGPVVPFEDASLLNSFHNSNPATYNSSNPGQQIDDLCVKRLSDEQNSLETSFGPPVQRACAVRFVDDQSGVADWGSAAAQRMPSSVAQQHRGYSTTTFPSARSMMDFKTAYETPHHSVEAEPPLPTLTETRMVTVSTSSSISSEPDGLRISQEVEYSAEPMPAMALASPTDFCGPVAEGISGNIAHPYKSVHDFQATEREAMTPFGGYVDSPLEDARVAMNNESKLLLQTQEPTLNSPPYGAELQSESAIKLIKPPYNEQFGYQMQGGAQDWLPYSSYRSPPAYPREAYDARALGGIAAPFALPTPPSRTRNVRIPRVEAFVATGGPTVPRKMLVRRNSPEFMRRQSPYSRLRPSTAGRGRKGRRLRSAPCWQQGEFSVGPRSTISAQQDIRLSEAYGPRTSLRPRRSLSPPRAATQTLQQTQFPMNVPGQYWNSTCPPNMTNSWHGGCYENPAFEPLPPVFMSTMPVYPSLASDSRGPWIPENGYRQQRRKRLVRVQSLSTFESHENADEEPRPLIVRSSAAARKPPTVAEQKRMTSAKTVQTEERGECAQCSSPTRKQSQFPKIIIPRVKTHVDIDDSNSESRHVNITRAATQTEEPCAPGGLPLQPSTSKQSPLLQNSGSQPFSGYVNQNFVCPPYMTNLNTGLAVPTPSSAMPIPIAGGPVQMQCPMAQMQGPMAQIQAPMAQIGYYGQTQIQSPAPAAPKAANSSSDRATACPLSSCFKGIFSHEEDTSEERPKKRSPHCCHREKTHRRARSPLPPPAIGNTFTVGYMMNSENELNPVLMPLNVTTAPPPEARAARTAPWSAQDLDAPPASVSQEDPVAKLEKRVQEQMVEIEKTIKEQDARWKENQKEEKKRKEKKKPENDSRGCPKRQDSSKQNRKQLKIDIAKVEESFSLTDSDTGSPSWFSWSRTSKSRKGVQLKVPRQQRGPSVRSMDSQTEEYASCSTSREKSEKSEKIAIPGVSSTDTATSGASFTWATRKKKASRTSAQSSPRGSPERKKGNNNSKRIHSGDDPSPRAAQGVSSNEPAKSGAGFTWATRRIKASAQSSPHGSPERKDANNSKRKDLSPASAPKSRDSSRPVSTKYRPPPNPKGSPTRSGNSSPARVERRYREQSAANITPSPDVAYSSESVADSDNELVAKIKVVGFPGATRTQRRWSRTEMHRSTSYDTAASSAAASSAKDRRAQSAQDFSGGESPSPRKKKSFESASDAPPSSCWQSVCNIFGGSPQPPSPPKMDAKKQKRRKSCCSSVCDICRFETEEESVTRKSSLKRRPSRTPAPTMPPPPVLPPPQMPPLSPMYYPTQPPPPPMIPPPPAFFPSDDAPQPPPPQMMPPPPTMLQSVDAPPPPPRLKRRQRGSEDMTERSEVKEEAQKPSAGGSFLSNIYNWFCSRSGEKQDKARRGSESEKERRDSVARRGSSFDRWMAEKERALKKNQSRLVEKDKKQQGSQGRVSSSRPPYTAGQPSVTQELYFEEEGGPRWVIRYSHSPSHSDSTSRSPARLAQPPMKAVAAPTQFPQPCGPPGALYSPDWVIQHSSGGRGSRERTPPLMTPSMPPFQHPFPPTFQPPPPLPSVAVSEAEKDWSVQYLYGPKGSRQGSPAHMSSQSPAKKPTPPVPGADFHQSYGQGMAVGPIQAVPPGPSGPALSGFHDTPDWSIRITQGREHSSSSRASVRSKKGQLEKHTGSKESAEQQPSFIMRIVEQPRRRSRRSSSLSLERSVTPENKKSEVSFQEKKDKKEKTDKTTPPPPAKPPPDILKPPAPAPPPPAPPVAPRAFRTEESLRHEFYEEMDERGRAATMFPGGAPGVGSLGGPESTALKMAELFFRGDELRKMPRLSESEGRSGAAMAAGTPPGEKKGSLPGTPTLKPVLKTSETKLPEAPGGPSKQRDKASTSGAGTPLGIVSPPLGDKDKAKMEGKKGSVDVGGKSSAAASGKSSPAPDAKGGKGGKKEVAGKDKKPIKSASDKPGKGPPKPKGGPTAPGEPVHTNYVLEQRRQERKLQWSDPLSYKCPTVQEVVGYAIVTAVLLLGLVLLVSVPKMRSHAVNTQD